MSKILVVDDVELNRALLCEMFRSSYLLCEAENGRQAMEILEEQGDSIAVVLLDIVMPVLDGFGVLREMAQKSLIGRIPVIMITGETSESVMRKGYEMGVADIVSKPFNPSIVRQRIHNIVEQYTYKLHLENLVEEQTRTLREQSQKLRENSAQIIDTLSTIIEFKNTESVQHIYNIRIATKLLLTDLSSRHAEYGLSEEQIESISEAAAMHDIGKIAIPDSILNKPGKLTPEEFEIMKSHTVHGCEILEKLSRVQNLAYYDYCYEICRHHHEKWDGRGYPDGLIGNQTPIWAQAVSLVDAFDALCSKRCYKDAYPCSKAVQMIANGECGAFNPVLLECFLAVAPALGKGYGVEEEQTPAPAPYLPAPGPKETTQDPVARALSSLELERRRNEILAEMSDDILFEYDPVQDRLTLFGNYRAHSATRSVRDGFLQSGARGALIPEDVDMLCRWMKIMTPSDHMYETEMQVRVDDQEPEWYRMRAFPIWSPEREPRCVAYMGGLTNIEQQKQESLREEKAAGADPLTGLANREAVRQQAAACLADERLLECALCFIDIDRFKSVNDRFGHAFGDRVLRRVAGKLASCAGETDLVGRIGGDEFILILRGIGMGEELEEKVRQIGKMLGEDEECPLTSSIGVTCYPQDGNDYDTLLYRADQALYLSKHGSGCQFYSRLNGDVPFRSLLSGVDDYDEKLENMAQALR